VKISYGVSWKGSLGFDLKASLPYNVKYGDAARD
jgi:hypothetical protein